MLVPECHQGSNFSLSSSVLYAACHSLLSEGLCARRCPPVYAPVTSQNIHLVLMILQKSTRVSELAAVKNLFLCYTGTGLFCDPKPLFLLVVSPYHLNQSIVSLSLCSAAKHPKEFSIHHLDIICAVRVWLLPSITLQHSNSLCVIPEDSCFPFHHH